MISISDSTLRSYLSTSPEHHGALEARIVLARSADRDRLVVVLDRLVILSLRERNVAQPVERIGPQGILDRISRDETIEPRGGLAPILRIEAAIAHVVLSHQILALAAGRQRHVRTVQRLGLPVIAFLNERFGTPEFRQRGILGRVPVRLGHVEQLERPGRSRPPRNTPARENRRFFARPFSRCCRDREPA